jgi:hypothetical protein
MGWALPARSVRYGLCPRPGAASKTDAELNGRLKLLAHGRRI